MNMKKTVRKMSAILAGATMVGATVMGAMAYDLSDYPSPFIKDGFFEGKIVIGEKAAPIDTIGATDIAAAMQADAVTAVSVDGTVSVAGGVTEEVALGGNLDAKFSNLDNSDVSSLKEGTLTIDIGDESDDYDWHEELDMSTGAVVQTALTADDEDLGDGVYLLLAKDSITYSVVFDDLLAAGHYINDSSDDEPITLEFLGKEMEIIGAPTATSIKVQVGETIYLDAGQKVTVSGKEITLVKTGADVAVVNVDGTPYNIASGATKKVGALRIKVKEVFNDDGVEFDSATLIVGEDASKTYATTDAFIGEDEDKPFWAWKLANLNTNNPTIAIEYDQTTDNLDDNPATIGESVMLPNDYAKVELVSLNQKDYRKYTVSTDSGIELWNDTVSLSSNAKVLLFSAEGSDDAFMLGTENTKEVAVWFDNTNLKYFYKDDDGKFKVVNANTHLESADSAGVFQIDHKKSTIDVVYNTSSNVFFVDTTTPISIAVLDGAFNWLGASDKDTTVANDIKYGGNDISGWETDALTAEGLLIYSYDASASRDEVSFGVPSDVTDNMVNVAVVGGAGSVKSTGGSGAYKINPIPTGSTILDKDAMSLLGKTPLLVVGGPAVNTVAAELMGNPTREQINTMFTAGVGKIKLYATQNALLVAGYEGQDTLGACYVLKDYADYDLTGTEVEVVVPSLSSISVRTPN